MSDFWKFWIFSGESGRYVDIDFNFWVVRGHLHILYGEPNVCTNPAHR